MSDWWGAVDCLRIVNSDSGQECSTCVMCYVRVSATRHSKFVSWKRVRLDFCVGVVFFLLLKIGPRFGVESAFYVSRFTPSPRLLTACAALFYLFYLALLYCLLGCHVAWMAFPNVIDIFYDGGIDGFAANFQTFPMQTLFFRVFRFTSFIANYHLDFFSRYIGHILKYNISNFQFDISRILKNNLEKRLIEE